MSKKYLAWRLMIFAAATILLFSARACAQNWIEQRVSVAGGTITPRVDGLLTGPLSDRWGSFAWFQVQQGYSEVYTGITYAPKSWAQVACGVGLEENRNPFRVGGYLWLGNSKSSLLINPEFGGSGGWWKIEAMRAVSKSVDLGFLQERYKGSGVEIRYRIPKTKAVIWSAPVVDKNPVSRHLRTNFIFGLRWNL